MGRAHAWVAGSILVDCSEECNRVSKSSESVNVEDVNEDNDCMGLS